MHAYKNIFRWKSIKEFEKSLLEQIIYNQNGLVVINKPLGIGVKKTEPSKHPDRIPNQKLHLVLRGIGSCSYLLQDAIPFLRSALNKPELVLVKSVDKFASGISVFADNDKEAKHFQDKLKVSKAKSKTDPLYRYHVVVVGDSLNLKRSFQEKVGIHSKSGPLSNLKQPIIEREFSINSVKRSEITPVYVRVNVIRKNSHGSLLEICTSSLKWNFLRVYCADILQPILGDHLFSGRVKSIMGISTKIDPTHLTPGDSLQKLSVSQLEALQLSQPEDTISIPPHIHLHSYVLENYFGKGKSLELEAPTYPDFYRWTLENFQLY